MFEYVGVLYYCEYFCYVYDKLLQDGVVLIYIIGCVVFSGCMSLWIIKYIFSGGYVFLMLECLKVVEKEGFWVIDVEVWWLYYVEMLKYWYDCFMDWIDEVREIYDERFCCMWWFYLIVSEFMFCLYW